MERHKSVIFLQNVAAPKLRTLSLQCFFRLLHEIIRGLFSCIQHLLRREAAEFIADVIHDKAHRIIRIRKMSQMIQIMLYHKPLHLEIVGGLQRNPIHHLISRFVNKIPLLLHALAEISGRLPAGSRHIGSNTLRIVHGTKNPPVSYRLRSLPAGAQPLFPIFQDHLIIQRKVKSRKSGISLSSATPSALQLLSLVHHKADPDDGKAAHLRNAIAQTNIRPTARDRSCHRHGVLLPGLLNDRSLLRNVVRIQNVMGNSLIQKHLRKEIRHLNRARNDKDRLSALMNVQHLLKRRLHLRRPIRINQIRIIHTLNLFSCRNNHRIKPIDLPEFIGIMCAGSRHPRKLPVHIEIALVGHRRNRAALLRYGHMLLRLQCLMLPAAKLGARLNAACFLIQKTNRPVTDNVALFLLDNHMRAQCQIDMTDDRLMLRRIKLMPLHTEKALCLPDSGLRQPDIFIFCFIITILLERRDEIVRNSEQIGLNSRHSRND